MQQGNGMFTALSDLLLYCISNVRPVSAPVVDG